MSNGGSVKIGGGSITIECDKDFTYTTSSAGHHKVHHLDKKITEVVITDESEQKAYVKFDVGLLPPGEKFFVKVNYKAAEKGATARGGEGSVRGG